MVVKASIQFLNDDSDGALVSRTEGIIDGLTGNAQIPTPVPPTAAIQGALDAFTAAIGAAKEGGKAATAVENARRESLAVLLRQLASYLTIECDGNLEMLLSSKFPIQKTTRSPIGTLSSPDAPGLQQKQTGVLIAKSAPVDGAGIYNWRVALASAPGIYVQTQQTTKADTLFLGLTPGQTYSVQLNAVGAAGPSDWSSNSSRMVT